ncbi:40S ribosomal protein S5 [Hibiscus syriacus]|uniref:40S ribosomal protein S5 n=1 Tax=Hibiscus syriacus TaxID=106335 RepID=A0A6A2Y066_HIBSY|nr:40S ribosomal protein S5 [Hibiscus syriacus]
MFDRDIKFHPTSSSSIVVASRKFRLMTSPRVTISVLNLPSMQPMCHTLPEDTRGPCEDATRIGSPGVVRRQAVDIFPLRRVNQAIYLLTTGPSESVFRNI